MNKYLVDFLEILRTSEDDFLIAVNPTALVDFFIPLNPKSKETVVFVLDWSFVVFFDSDFAAF
jgi:hypothetical protein